MPSRTFVLGASGYLGSAVTAAVIARRGEANVICSRDLAALPPQNGPSEGDVIINCVGYYGTEAPRLREANVDHAVRVAEAAHRTQATMLHISSSAVFDAMTSGEVAETTPPAPASAYGRSKAVGESRVLDVLPAARIYRPAKVFGGSDPRERLHSLARYVARGYPLPLPRRPALWANFVWIDDLAAVLAEAANSPAGPTHNHLASPVEWARFVQLLADALGRPARRLPQPLNPVVRVAASGCARLPEPRPRLAARVLEMWDRLRFVDSARLLDDASVRRGLHDLADRVA